MGKYENKVVLVTGGTGVIGSEISLFLAKKGLKVIITYNNRGKEAERIVMDNENIYSINLDLNDDDSIRKCVDIIKERYGRLDFLINNAGIIEDSLFMNMDNSSIRKVIDVNLTGTMILTKECLGLIRQSKGRIINIASVAGESGNIGQANYSASKAGLIGFTKTLAKELAKFDISVNAISLGIINSDLTDKIPDKVMERIISMIPMKKKGEPKAIAELVYFLLSNEGNYITGQVIRIDGGLYM